MGTCLTMKISVAIMTHSERRDHAKALKSQLDKMWFQSVEIIYDTGDGEWETGKRAMQNGVGKGDWHVVLQDDAIISDVFYENLYSALKAVPERNLVSLYLGRVKPYAYDVIKAFRRATALKCSWISSNSLYWGVGVVIPTEDIEPMLRVAQQYPRFWYDRRVGQYYFASKKKVYYTTISLVDHNYKLPSLIGHDTRQPRVCHRFAGNELVQYNSKCIAM